MSAPAAALLTVGGLTAKASEQSWVDTDLTAIESPQKRMSVAAVLDRGAATALADGVFRVTCDNHVRAISIAAHLRHLGVPFNAISIGSGK